MARCSYKGRTATNTKALALVVLHARMVNQAGGWANNQLLQGLWGARFESRMRMNNVNCFVFPLFLSFKAV